MALDKAMERNRDSERESGVPPAGSRFDDLLRAVALTRDRTAFAELFRFFAPRVKSYLMRLGVDAALAEELMQEAMIMVWRRADSFDPRQASVGTWIFTIARNKRIDALRREKRPTPDPADPALSGDPPVSAEARVAGAETERRMRRALEQLPAEQAELIKMAYFDDETHSMIAAKTRLPLGTVKSRLRLALGRLRRTLEDIV
ncbi:sigma-70 family RNA polymerase sigma factor [Virgifigura deserti]|uniref:sigma-70 family RNA polymerase sigma factor n=1 Tax=Virgifigura deserti TaxID=2268457 RepID=UPI003CCBBB9A